MRQKICITGASGFIGRLLARRFSDQGYKVFGTYFREKPAMEAIHWVKLDLLDEDAVRLSMRAISPDVLIHTAWLTRPSSYANIQENLNWLCSSIKLVEKFIEQGGTYFVGFGSCAEYDWNSAGALKEGCIANSMGVFGATKASFNHLSHELCKSAGVSQAWLRPFFVYGPTEPGHKLISSLIRATMNHEKYVCKNGDAIRDYIYVEDLVDAVFSIVNRRAEGEINLGTGEGIRVRDIVKLVERYFNVCNVIEVQSGLDKTSVIANIQKLEQHTMVSTFRSIEDGIRNMCNESLVV